MKNSVFNYKLLLVVLGLSLFLLSFKLTSAAYLTSGNTPWLQSPNSLYYEASNVGIGLDNPEEKLSINGDIGINANSQLRVLNDDNHSIFFKEGDLNSINYYEYGGNLVSGLGHKFYTGGNKVGQVLRLQIADDASYFQTNVSIGTSTTPAVKLHIAGGTGNVLNVNGGRIIGLNDTPNSDDEAVPLGFLQANYSSTTAMIAASLWSGAKNGNIWNGDSGVGNVGIGTTTPAGPLHVFHASNGSILETQGNNNINLTIRRSDVPGRAISFMPAGFSDVGSGANEIHQKISFSGGTVALLEAVGSNRFIFNTNGTTKMSILSNGNVGIGTTNPAVKLTLQQGDQTYTPLWTTPTGEIAFGIAANTSAISGMDFKNFNSAGQVRLMARNNDNNYIVMNAMGTTATASFFGQAGNQLTIFSVGKRFSLGTNDSQPLILGTSNTERMRILSNGNVGINTTTPAVKLHIVGGTGNALNVGGGRIIGLNDTPNSDDEAVPYKFFKDYLQANYSSTSTASNMVTWGGNTLGSKKLIGSIDDYDIGFITNNTEKMTILENGNVGIGTTTPTSLLHLNGGTGKLATGLSFGDGDTGFYEQSDDILYLYTSNTLRAIFSNYNIQFGVDVIPTSNITKGLGSETRRWSKFYSSQIADNGTNVGIGTTAPSQKLDVSGKIALDGTTIAYLPTAFTGTLILGDGGTNLQTGADYNTFVGIGAGASNTTGERNTANGYFSLYSNTTGSGNAANGYYSLHANTTGSNNTANGFQSLYFNATGGNNTANGYRSLYSNTTGSSNTANGYQALYGNTTGNYNTANGVNAGRYIADGGANETGSNSLFLGAETRANDDGETNQIVIGYGAIGNGSNSVTLGNDDITTTILKGSVGIGTSTLAGKLTVDGSVFATGYYHSSDIRLKENVKSLTNVLVKIKRLKPVEFSWKNNGEVSQGFIAQELEQVLPELVHTSPENGLKSVEYANLTAILTAGIQEQAKKIEQLQTEIEILKLRLNKLDQ